MINIRYTEDSINDIKKIICYYSDTIDYTVYIQDLETIIDRIKTAKGYCSDTNELTQLSLLEEKAAFYLEKTRDLQLKYENSQNEQ